MQLLTPALGLIFWTTLIFLTIVFILGKYAWKPILKALDDREKTIDDSLKTAERMKQEMANMHSEHEKLLNEAKAERSSILKEAKDMKDSIISEARNQAKAEQTKIVEDARREIENQKMAALTEIKNSVGAMVLQVSEKVLQRELKDKTAQTEYMSQLIKDTNLN